MINHQFLFALLPAVCFLLLLSQKPPGIAGLTAYAVVCSSLLLPVMTMTEARAINVIPPKVNRNAPVPPVLGSFGVIVLV